MSIPARIIRAIREAAFPTKCAVCRTFLTPAAISGHPSGCMDKPISFDSILASFVCPECRKRVIPVNSPLCKRCGIMFDTREGDDHLCNKCILSSKQFHSARSTGLYEQTLMTLVHQFKYRGKIRLAHPLGMMLLRTYLQFFPPEDIDFIVPVPLHTRRFRQRGFNQAYLLVKDWKRFCPRLPEVSKDVLFRTRWTEPQTGLGRMERIKNIRRAFSVNNVQKFCGKKILLIDDVYTTGATVNECARVLRTAGAKQVDVLTLARAQ